MSAPSPIVMASWEAHGALASLEVASNLDAADIAAGHVLDTTARLRELGDESTARYIEGVAGEAYFLKLVLAPRAR